MSLGGRGWCGPRPLFHETSPALGVGVQGSLLLPAFASNSV